MNPTDIPVEILNKPVREIFANMTVSELLVWAMAIGRVLHGLRTGRGLVGAAKGILFGDGQPKEKTLNQSNDEKST
jgi:hypothetical protein